MRKIAWTGGLLLLATSTLAATPCTPSATTLCLNASRFEGRVSWRDRRGRTGVGQAVPITADTGYFWFFSEANVELVVKVLDARALSGKYWVFFGALSSVEYDLTVTDTASGAVKTYHNPLGQFASVGDTSAFDPGVAAPTRETVTAEGAPVPPASLDALQGFIDAASAAAPAPAAFTPCPIVGSTLRLNGCRYSLEVEWRDSRGREGRGTPVQLTNDTGFFWFFSPDNVELVIKVLDARSINGSHWVFYGALSSVQYTLTVRDSLTGAVRIYSNPLGTFASAGDTEGFHAGRSVGAVPDSTRTAFATFDSAGGTLSVSGTDGTQYVLELPPDALGMETTVRMTPLARIDRLPLARGLVGAVQLEPEGLRLFVPATLHIRPARPLRRGIVGFSFHGPGEDFALDAGEAANGEVRVPVFHFSGAGAGAAGVGDAGMAQAPLDLMAHVRQLALQIIDRAQEHEDEDGNVTPPEISLQERHDLLVALFIDTAYNVILPRLQATLPQCHKPTVEDAMMLALACIQEMEFFTDADQIPELQEAIQTLVAKILEILNRCLEKFFNDCKSRKDPFIAWDMVLILRQLELFGQEVGGILDQGGYIERCLRFELEVDSTVTLARPGFSERLTAQARVPLRIDPTNSVRDVAWSGSDRISLTDTVIAVDGCSTTGYDLVDAEIDVGQQTPALLMPFAFAAQVSSDPELFTSFPIRVGYDPGYPMAAARASCSGQPTEFGLSSWRLEFDMLHSTEHPRGGGGTGTSDYLAENWELFNLPNMFARKSYQGSKTEGVNRYSEESELIIRHTPDE